MRRRCISLLKDMKNYFGKDTIIQSSTIALDLVSHRKK
ncbi:hypothetical protein FORMA_15320 [Formosa sp. Hel3_A1_48]|nr:hypothetical protein FORMA_15320 [Formosa sp. Hel3_A1_48]